MQHPWFRCDPLSVPNLQIYEGAKQAYASLAQQMEKHNRCAVEHLSNGGASALCGVP